MVCSWLWSQTAGFISSSSISWLHHLGLVTEPCGASVSSSVQWGQQLVVPASQGFETDMSWGTWVAQWAEYLTSAQVTISQFVSWSPASGSGLTAQSPCFGSSLSLSLCASPAHILSLSFSQKQINIKKREMARFLTQDASGEGKDSEGKGKEGKTRGARAGVRSPLPSLGTSLHFQFW